MDEPEKEKAKPGWYKHPTMADTKRYWDGQAWTDDIAPASVAKDAPTSARTPPAPDSPYGYVLLGVITAALGGALIALGLSDEDGSWVFLLIGYVMAGIGWVATMVGVIGAG